MNTTMKLTAAEKRKQEQAKQLATDGKAFRQRSQKMSMSLLVDWVGEERAAEAAGRISAALASSAMSARNPGDFYACTPASVARCVAVAALTGIMPSTGAGSLAYLIPRRARKGEAPMLNYQLSHRGLNALANRAKRTMIAIPIGMEDVIEVDDAGEVLIKARDIDNPPEDFEQLRGIMLTVKNTDTGVTLSRNFVSSKVIAARRAVSDSYRSGHGPWMDWPIEMAQKTAMHYAIARGMCVVDDTEAIRALTVDIEGDHQMPVTAGLEEPESDEMPTLESKVAKATAEMMIEPEPWEVAVGEAELAIDGTDDPDKLAEIIANVAGTIPDDEFDRLKKMTDAKIKATSKRQVAKS